jgi:tetratricopeptide (TPR) repeat protein
MVGRASEHARLVEAFHRVRSGRTETVLIEGEAGIGKTRLAHEFLAWAKVQGALALRGRSFETGGRLPYQPILELLRGWLERETHPLEVLPEVWLGELSVLLPELRERFPGLPKPTVDEGIGRTRLFESVARLILALCARGPLIVFVDDQQWTDTASLDVLHYVIRRASETNANLLVIFTVRSEALPITPGLTDWLDRLVHDVSLERFELRALTEHATKEWLQLLSESDHGIEAFSRWLFTETRGQPLFINQTLKNLQERGVLQSHTNTGLEYSNISSRALQIERLAPGVREVIRARFQRLSHSAFALLSAGAVLGQDLEFSVMCQVAGLPESDGLTALDELLGARLLLEAERYSFAHDKIRDVMYTEAGDARRKVFHRRALEMFEAAKAPAAVLARHALAAHLWLEGFNHSLKAGDEAAHVFAWHESAGHYGRAHAILHDRPDGVDVNHSVEARTLIKLYSRLVRRYETLEFRDAIIPLEALEQAEWLEHPWLQAHALLLHPGPSASQDAERLLELREDARVILEWLGDHEALFEIEAATDMDVRASISRFVDDGITRLKALLRIAGELGHPEREWTLDALAVFHQDVGQWTEAIGYWQELLALPSTERTDRKSYRFENLGLCQLNIGDLKAALPNLLESYRIKVEDDNDKPSYVAMAACFYSYGLLESGALHEAVEMTETAFAQRHNAASRHAAEYGLAFGMSQMAVGRCAEARKTLKGALSIKLNEQHFTFREFLESHLCAVYALEGDWIRAVEHAQNAVQLRAETNNERGFHAPRLKHWLETEALLRGGQDDLAREGVRHLGETTEPNERLRVTYLCALAVLEVWDGQLERSIKSLREALELALEIGLPSEVWQIDAKLAELLEKHGDLENAVKARDTALEIVNSLAAKIPDEAMRATFLEFARAQGATRVEPASS